MSPLIARPFLRSRCVLVVNYTTIIDEWPYANSTTGIDNSTHIFHTQEEMHRDTHVRWAYWIVALVHVSMTRRSTLKKLVKFSINSVNYPKNPRLLHSNRSEITYIINYNQ